MASELTMSGSLTFDDDVDEYGLSVSGRTQTITTKAPARHIQTIPTSEEAIDLLDITPSAVMIVNRDPTNYVEIKTGASGTIIARLDPDTSGNGKGGFVIFSRLGSGITAPVAIANTAACKIAIFQCPI